MIVATDTLKKTLIHCGFNSYLIMIATMDSQPFQESCSYVVIYIAIYYICSYLLKAVIYTMNIVMTIILVLMGSRKIIHVSL